MDFGISLGQGSGRILDTVQGSIAGIVMLSTYLDYKLLNKNLQQSLDRVSGQAAVARETKYYKENIGKVTSVKEFLADHRLYKYAMEAFGLDDMIYAKAFMKKVLESDLSDDNSFVNRLSDERYRGFAKAFQFSPDGTSFAKPDVQTDRQEDDMIGLYNQQIINKANAVESETEYYKSAVGKITNVDDFANDRRLVEYSLKAFGIDPTYYSARIMKQVLTSDPSDPASYLNSIKDPAYSEVVQALETLASSFNFRTDGTLPIGTPAQTEVQIKSVTEAYVLSSSSRVTPLAAQWNTEYFESKAPQITSVTEFMSDGRLLSYLETAFGIEDSTAARESIAKALTSDLNDPQSFANQSNNDIYRKLARLFNFQADGTVLAGQTMLGRNELAEVTVTYMAAYDDADQQKDSGRTAFYKNMIGTVEDVDGLLNNFILYDYVLEAFGLDPKTESKSTIRQVLTSDLSDPKSYANQTRDSRYIGLADAFNFSADGKIRAALVAQSEGEISATASAYLVGATDRGQTLDDAKAETAYYREQIDRVSSLDDLLKDKRLLTYVMSAFGVTLPDTLADFMERLLKSDLDDPESFANKLQDKRYAQLAASFNFDADGNIVQRSGGQAQSLRSVLNIIELHTRQTLEKQSGEENDGLRLALYFQRKAPGLTSVYGILADRALQQVVFKALGLPDEMAQAPIDQQAELLKNRLNLADFKDPEKLEKFLGRFSVRYDLENGTASSPVMALFQGGDGSDISVDAMVSFSQLRASRYY
ncbi:DUF1217 domain-containing protein [Microvirga puerhi]|uniref:DUF1217 domain-containing protein n=1 Tax=Microvirga puerhi TaxID=2876078 RepID=A0ABS7VQ02_9HYPH|nr:DUF1217 domain-containing protein [Microvirga puerhi]MBZ6077600.1 DUF1217 domain-containing protein [Microvirga puerhi]